MIGVCFFKLAKRLCCPRLAEVALRRGGEIFVRYKFIANFYFVLGLEAAERKYKFKICLTVHCPKNRKS